MREEGREKGRGRTGEEILNGWGRGKEEREEEGEEEAEMLGGNNGPMEVRLLSTNQSDHCSASQRRSQ